MGGGTGRSDFPISGGGYLYITNHQKGQFTAIFGIFGLYFASTGPVASPQNFSTGADIDSAATFKSGLQGVAFGEYGVESPNFGPDSFMGFRTSQGNYGWLEVTWDNVSENFEILAGAYEDQVGAGIAAGDTGISAIPEPASVLGTMGLLASGLLLRTRRKAA